MTDYGASDTSTTTLGANQFPISEVYVPNVGLRATEGGPASTDGTGKASAPVSMSVKDGSNVAQGATTDAAATTDTGTFTLMALFKRLLQGVTTGNTNTSNTATNTSTVAGAVTASVVQSNTKQVNGTTTSVNAGNRDAGTQRIKQAGNGSATVTQVGSSATSAQALAANTNKEGTLFFNDSTQVCYLLYGAGTASATNYSTKIPSQGLFEDPLHFTGVFTVVWAAANGFLYCTEVS